MEADTGQTQVDLVRHGEHALGHVVCGVTDPELTELGWSQLQKRIETLASHGSRWDVCLSSPRRRCAEFARHMARQHGIPYADEPGFSEVDFGQWEAMSYDQIQENHPGQWQQWISNPADPAPHGGERYGEFLHRIESSWNALVEAHRGKKIVLFAHGGVIRAVFRAVLSLDSGNLNRFNVPHACHTRIIVYHHPGKPDLCQLERHHTF